MIHRRITDNNIEAIFSYEENNKPSKTIILLTGSQGGFFADRSKLFTESIVSKGYSVLDLAYFRKRNLPKFLYKIPLEYFENVFQWLSKQPETIPNYYAIIGISKGAELSLLLASRYPQLKAIIAVVPSNVVFQAPLLFNGSSWSYNKKEIPYVHFPLTYYLFWGSVGFISRKFTHLYEKSLNQYIKNKSEPATIPVEKIKGSILLLSALYDNMWPSKKMSELIMDRLSEHNYSYYYEHKIIESNHWVLAKKEARESLKKFLENHFPVE